VIGIDASQHTATYHQRLYARQQLYAEGSWLNEPAEEVMQALRLVPESAMVLDLGCGVGRHTIPAAQLNKVRGVIAVDSLPIAIEELRNNTRHYAVEDKVLPRLQRIESYSFPPRTFDAIIAFSALAHLSGPAAFDDCLERLHRSLRRTGFAILSIMADVSRCDEKGATLPNGIEIPFEAAGLTKRIAARFKIMHRAQNSFELDEEFEGRSSRLTGSFQHYLVGQNS